MTTVEHTPEFGDESVHLVAVDALDSESSLFSRAWDLGRSATEFVWSLPQQARGVERQLKRHLNGSYDPEFLQEHFDPIEVKTDAGTYHHVRLLNREDLRNSHTGLLVTFPLGVRSDHGFLVDQIAELQAHCHEIGIGMVTISNEGFARPVNLRKLPKLDFDVITANVWDALDGAQKVYNAANWHKPIDIHYVIPTGPSRGGTTSLKLANPALPEAKGLDYAVLGTIPIAPAGRSRLSLAQRALVAHQFGFGETRSEINKFMSANFTGKLKRFGQLAGTLPHWQALPATARTGLEYLYGAPLERIEHEIPVEVPVHVLAYDKDRVTTPHVWSEVFADHPGRRVVEPGSHLDLENATAREFIKSGLADILGHAATTAA